MCECSEKDWSGVDQTVEHHPDCLKQFFNRAHENHPGEREGKEVFVGGNLYRHLVINLNKMNDTLTRLDSRPAKNVVHLGLTADPHSLEACQQRGFPGLTDDEVELESDVLQIIEANPEWIARAIVKCLQQSTEAAQVLRQELSKGR